MYCILAVVVDTVDSHPFLAQKNWSIFYCFTQAMVLLHVLLL